MMGSRSGSSAPGSHRSPTVTSPLYRTQMSKRPPLSKRLSAEALGSFFLFATVIGSGIMAANLSGGNDAVALLGNTLATGAILFVLITMLGPISGAHMNPAVSLVAAARGELRWADAGAYVAAQLVFGIAGAWAAHLMFDLPTLQLSVKARTGLGQWVGEAIATFGLIVTILGTLRHRPTWVPASVALVHHRGLLVHLVDQLRQPGDHHRAEPVRHVRGDRAGRRAIVRGGATGRCGGGGVAGAERCSTRSDRRQKRPRIAAEPSLF